MSPSSICINTQTPLVQFLRPVDGGAELAAGAAGIDVAGLRPDVDYRFSPGGVTRMVYPLVRRLVHDGVLENVHWVALNPQAPTVAHLGPITLHSVTLPPERLAGYGEVKEALWGRIHRLGVAGPQDDLFWTEAFSEYAYYNRRTAELLGALDAAHDFDAFYIHDFQQMPVGQMLNTLKPKAFRWHIPFDAQAMPSTWREVLTGYLDSYDTIVVSAARYARSLATLTPRKRIVRLYPYIDPADYSHPDAETVRTTCDRLGIAPDDDVALLVGRMDPIKGQDLAITAFESLAARFPHLRLVLVGNGSFSGSASGLGMSKSAGWRSQLEHQVSEAGLGARVTFTGHLPQADLDCLYARCRFALLPSVAEGFGLVAVESWLHGKPAIVSRSAGIAELIHQGENGLLFDPARPDDLAAQMQRLLADRTGALAARIGKAGQATARQCSLAAAQAAERAMLAELTEA